MLTPYSPLEFMEALTKERHGDPRIIAARGSHFPVRRPTRARMGEALVRFGRWIGGSHLETAASNAS